MIRDFTFALMIAGIAASASAEESKRLTAAYDDLDAAKPADVETFDKRLDDLAKAACAGRPAVQVVDNRRYVCRKVVRERAVAQLPEAWRTALEAR